MEGLLSVNLSIAFGAIVPSLILGSLVLMRGSQDLKRRIFAFSCLCIVLWAIATYFSLQPSSNMLFWVRVVMFFAVLLQYIFLMLVSSLGGEKLEFRKLKFWGPTLVAALALMATQTPYVFSAVEIVKGEAIPTPGLLMPFFAFAILLFFTLGGVKLMTNLKKSSGTSKAQFLYAAVGYFSMFALLILTQFVLVAVFKNTSFVKFGPLFTLPFTLLTAYAILKHHLFNIRIIATEIFAFAIILVFTANVFLSANRGEFVLNIFLAIVISMFGFLLVRGTIREITELERLSKAKSDFVSIVSHQLRTPLTAIKGFVSMIQEGSGTAEDRKDWLEKAYATNERMIRLVNDILNISRIERGKIQYSFEEVDIVKLIDELIAEIRMQTEAKGLVLNWEHPQGNIPHIRADEEKLRQVIQNLVDNAVKYTEKGSVSVRLAYLKDLRRIKVSVQDTGIGITQDDQKRLFEQFSRGKEGQKTNVEGLGLGLFVAQSIVRAHNGRIWAESEGPHKGSRFYVELPVQ